MSYSTTKDVWKYLGKDAFTKVRDEVVATGNGTTSSFELDHDNVIDGTYAIYTSSVLVTSSVLDLDNGTISPLTASNGSVITADYDYADIEDSQIVSMISSSDLLLESLTGRTYGTTSTTEYIDVNPEQRDFFTRHYPIITISSLSYNDADEADTADWSASTIGLGNDYLCETDDMTIGRFRYIDNWPSAGKNKLKMVYTYGYSATPSTIKELSILMTIRSMVGSAIYKSIFTGKDSFTNVRLDEINARIEELIRINRKQDISPA